MSEHAQEEIVRDWRLTMTPLPKYFAKSKRLFGMRELNHFVLLANTGKRAPKREPTRMMNMEATRRPKKSSEPPPLPQFNSASRAAGSAVGSSVTAWRTSSLKDLFRSILS